MDASTPEFPGAIGQRHGEIDRRLRLHPSPVAVIVLLNREVEIKPTATVLPDG
jgi:hypothetical protein